MEGDRLEVLVQTETRAARELLEARGADLQTALEQHGVKVDRFEVAATLLENRQDAAGSFAQADDSSGGQPATGQDAEQSSGHSGSGRDDSGHEPTQAVEVGGRELTVGAAAETRLDVRV